jgi:hypothetical protein
MEHVSTLNQHCRPSATPLAQPRTQIARKSAKHSKTLQIRILQNAKNLFNGNGMKIVHRRPAMRQISEGNLDLTRQIAHEQSRLAFGAGRACTKAFQMKKLPQGCHQVS